jgi:vesicle-associated membrane protein 4
MKDNIQQILVNNEKIENIEAQSEALNNQAQAFQSQSTELTNKMFWKMWKMRLLLGGLIVVVLIIIIVPSVVASQPQQDQTTKRLRG